MPIVPAGWVNAEQISCRMELLQMQYAGNPAIDRIEYSVGTDWSGDPALFINVTLSPPMTGSLNSLAEKLRMDVLRVVRAEDLGLHSYLNFVQTSSPG